MEVSGETRLGETTAAGQLLARKLMGRGWGPLAVYLIALAAVLMLSSTVLPLFLSEAEVGIGAPALVILTAVGGFWLFMKWRLRSLVTGWQARGVPMLSAVTFRIDPDAMQVDNAGVHVRCLWPGVSELAQTKLHWVFIVPGLAYCVPKRFFATPAEERAFVRAALERMTPEARARSDAATTFVGVWE
jgi:hypothetical protein